LKYQLLRDPSLHGWEYGMLRDFESAIIAIASPGQAGVETLAPYPRSGFLRSKTAPGTRYAPLRHLLPKQLISKTAENVASIVMGPEGSPFWSRRKQPGQRVASYIFDTLEPQRDLLLSLCRTGEIDFPITSFPNAVPMLQALTKRPWHAIAQGVSLDRFWPLAAGVEPPVAFSAYGRRLDSTHQAIKRFVQSQKLHYDYTLAAGLSPQIDPADAYTNYAWDMRNCWFTISWPVEVTNPTRAPSFSPMTCRWFEAAASGTIVLGKAPLEPEFERYFGPNFVVEIPRDQQALLQLLPALWERRHDLRAERLQRWRLMRENWSWDARSRQLLALFDR
jgi:hypothetical protein